MFSSRIIQLRSTQHAQVGSTLQVINQSSYSQTFSAQSFRLQIVIRNSRMWSSDQNNQTVDARIRAAENNGANDSIVSDKADRMDAAKPGESQEPQNMPNKNAGQ